MATMYTIREYLRVGDLMEMKIEVNGKAIENEQPEMVSVIRSDNMLVIIVISTNCKGYNEVICTSGTHWYWDNLTIDTLKVTVNLDDLKLDKSNSMISEVKDGKIETSDDNKINGVKFEYNEVDDYFALKNIDMGENPTVVRVFLVPVVNL